MRRAPHDGLQPAALATEGQQLVVPAISTAQPQEPVGQDAAFQEGVELVLDELRQVSAGSVFGLGEESRGVLLHQAVQRGLLGAVALVVDRGAIAMRPPGLVSGVGLHALGIWNLGWCSFSGRAGQCIRLCEDHHLPSPRQRPSSGAVPCPAAPAPGHAVAALARWRPRHDLSIDPGRRLSTPAQSRRPTKKAENAYPRPRDRRLSRKTRAAVGKPPGSTTPGPAVSRADSTGANTPSIAHQANGENTTAVARRVKLAQHRPRSIPHWLSQPG